MSVVPHMLCLTATMVTLCGATSTPANADDLKEIFSICSDLGNDRSAIHSQLLKQGWKDIGGEEQPGKLLFWQTFARDYSMRSDASLRRYYEDDFTAGHALGFVLENATFMSGSVLGNSALPAGQLAYEKNGVTLGLLGVSLGKGYCIASGPRELFESVLAMDGYSDTWPADIPKDLRSGINLVGFLDEDIQGMAATLDPEIITNTYEENSVSFKHMQGEYDPEMLSNMPTSIIYMTPLS